MLARQMCSRLIIAIIFIGALSAISFIHLGNAARHTSKRAKNNVALAMQLVRHKSLPVFSLMIPLQRKVTLPVVQAFSHQARKISPSPRKIVARPHKATHRMGVPHLVHHSQAVAQPSAPSTASIINQLGRTSYAGGYQSGPFLYDAMSKLPLAVQEMFVCIRYAESRDNYSWNLVSVDGARGAYQIEGPTWATAAAWAGVSPWNVSPQAQDAVAAALYEHQGWSPWAGDPCVG